MFLFFGNFNHMDVNLNLMVSCKISFVIVLDKYFYNTSLKTLHSLCLRVLLIHPSMSVVWQGS